MAVEVPDFFELPAAAHSGPSNKPDVATVIIRFAFFLLTQAKYAQETGVFHWILLVSLS